MSFLRSRHEQLADHLREQIRAGQLTEPLPNTRDWADRLGVSTATLHAALHALERERLIAIAPRQGVRLQGGGAKGGETFAPSGLTFRHTRELKVVRLIRRAADAPPDTAGYADWHGALSQQLQNQGIQFQIERCSDERLRALSRGKGAAENVRELLLLASLSEKYQRMFARSARPSVVIGYRAPGVSLPFVTADLEGALRHAAHGLFRRGFPRVTLLMTATRIQAVERQCDAFTAACRSWPRQPVQGDILRVPVESEKQLTFLNHLAGRIKDRRGFIVPLPVSLPAVVTTLLGHGVAIPGQVEVVAINTAPSATVMWPPLLHYQVSADTLAKSISRVATHFFDTGTVPATEKTLTLEVVRPNGELR